MKISRTVSSNRAAFTLIELLVVITILGILMGMAVSGTGAIKNQARKAQARNDCTGIMIAIKAFYTDYSRYPISSSKTDDTPYEPTKGPEGNQEIMEILTAANTAINPRGVIYYEAKSAKTGSDGAPVNGIKGGMFDPWGWTYGIVIDGDYDGKLNYSGSMLGTLDETQKMIPGGAGVFSLGDKQKNPVRSWE